MNQQKLVLGLTGDVMIGRGVNHALLEKGYSYIWGNVLPALQQTDVNIVNLEAALTNSDKRVFKTFNFKARPDRVSSLTAAHITVANLANNHILDFSEDGLYETIQTLISAGIRYVGAGKNDREASKPVIVNKNDISLGILGFTDNEPSWKAGVNICGVNYIDISDKKSRMQALAGIRLLKQETDHVIVSIHWGPNMKESPDRHFIEFAHEMVSSGASIIHGHSAHNFQGIEVYDEKLIFYDTGDFVDDYVVDPDLKNDHSFFYRIELDRKGILGAELMPVLIANYQVNLASGWDYEWSLRRMQDLSSKFHTILTDKGQVKIKNILTTT